MKKLMLTLAIMITGIAQAAVPKTGTIIIPSNTVSAVTSVAIGDPYNFQREVDSIKLTVVGKTDTNIVLVATLGQPFIGLTNTISTQSFIANGTTLVFPRQVFYTNGVERFFTDTVSLSCAFVMATNTAVSATLTNASAVSISIIAK
jgi:hypothetical protein